MGSELFWDTSGFFALLNKDDAMHGKAREVAANTGSGFRAVTTDGVGAETCTLLIARRKPHLVERFLNLTEQHRSLEVILTAGVLFEKTKHADDTGIRQVHWGVGVLCGESRDSRQFRGEHEAGIQNEVAARHELQHCQGIGEKACSFCEDGVAHQEGRVLPKLRRRPLVVRVATCQQGQDQSRVRDFLHHRPATCRCMRRRTTALVAATPSPR